MCAISYIKFGDLVVTFIDGELGFCTTFQIPTFMQYILVLCKFMSA